MTMRSTQGRALGGYPQMPVDPRRFRTLRASGVQNGGVRAVHATVHSDGGFGRLIPRPTGSWGCGSCHSATKRWAGPRSGTAPGAPAYTCEATASWRVAALLLIVEVVAQTSPGEAAGSLLSVGSELAHLVRRERPVHRGSPRTSAVACTSASALRVFSDGFLRQPPSGAGVSLASAQTTASRRKRQ
jgi:hypothetical protein